MITIYKKILVIITKIWVSTYVVIYSTLCQDINKNIFLELCFRKLVGEYPNTKFLRNIKNGLLFWDMYHEITHEYGVGYGYNTDTFPFYFWCIQAL